MVVENQKGSDLLAEVLEAGSIRVQTLPMASNKVLPAMLIPS